MQSLVVLSCISVFSFSCQNLVNFGYSNHLDVNLRQGFVIFEQTWGFLSDRTIFRILWLEHYVYSDQFLFLYIHECEVSYIIDVSIHY